MRSKEFREPRRIRQAAFTLVEVSIVLGIIVILVAIAAPTWIRQREISRSKACQQNLTRIGDAKEMYAMEFRASNGAPIVYPDNLTRPPGAGVGEGFLRSPPLCPSSGTYDANPIGEPPTCSIGSSNAPFEPHIMPKR